MIHAAITDMTAVAGSPPAFARSLSKRVLTEVASIDESGRLVLVRELVGFGVRSNAASPGSPSAVTEAG